VRTEPRGRKARPIAESTELRKEKNSGAPLGYPGRIALRREQCLI
jgi:hypothetical protein